MTKLLKKIQKHHFWPILPISGQEVFSKFCSHQFFNSLTKYHYVKVKKQKTNEQIPSKTGFR